MKEFFKPGFAVDAELYRSDPRDIAPLMGLEREEYRHWHDDELAEILQHQLQAPLLFDLAGVMESVDLTIPRDEMAAIGSFGELLQHSSPPLTLLKLMKEFAKSSDRAGEAPLPPEIATALYYASIAAALARHGERISRLTPDELHDGLEWGLQQPWLNNPGNPLRDLLAEALVIVQCIQRDSDRPDSPDE